MLEKIDKRVSGDSSNFLAVLHIAKGKLIERLGRKTIGPVKWQPVSSWRNLYEKII